MSLGEMPERPREHERESDSRHAFEGLMRRQRWLVRDLDTAAEYGIDQEVEIFEDHKATGLTFRVQAKGIARPDGIGPYTDPKLKTFNYWHSLDAPVLLVLWVEATDTLYGRWVHNFDFGPDPRGEKTCRVRFAEADRLETRVHSLREEVEVFRLLGSGGVPRPLPVAVLVDPDEKLLPLRYAFRRYIHTNGLRPYLRLLEEPTPRCWIARVEVDRLRVEQPSDVGSLNTWLPDYSTRHSPDQIIADILVSLGVLIGKLGATSDALRLFRVAGPDAHALDAPHGWGPYIAVAVREEAPDILITKIEELLARPADEDAEEAVGFYLMGLLDIAWSMTKSHVKSLRAAAKRAIRTAEQSADTRAAARTANNVANIFKFAGAWRWVEEFVDLAAHLDPEGYGERGDVLLLRGNARWNQSNFEGAVTAYRAARDHGVKQSEIVPPLSDALFQTGRYREAAELLDSWWDSEHKMDARSVLRRIILEQVIVGLGLETQDRRPRPGLVDELNDADDDSVKQAQIDSDALDVGLWFLRTNPDSVLGRWAIAALRTNHPQAWIMTLVLVRFSEFDDDLISTLIDETVRVAEVVEHIGEMKDVATDYDELRAFLDQLVTKALDYKFEPESWRRINVVNSENRVVSSLTFNEDGELLAFKGDDLDDEGASDQDSE